MKEKKYYTGGSVSKSNSKIVKIGDTSMSLIQIYMTPHCPMSWLTLQYTVVRVD